MSGEAHLLAEIIDVSVRSRPGNKGGFYCVFCHDTAPTPPKVRHKVGCVIERAQALLRYRTLNLWTDDESSPPEPQPPTSSAQPASPDATTRLALRAINERTTSL